MSLGQRIRHLRQSRGLTQSELGGGQLSKSFISLLEKDRTRPSLDTLLLIARRLGSSVDALLGQQNHLPELVCEGLLSLSRDALHGRDFDRAKSLLESASFVASRYQVDEAARETLLQSAQMAMEERRFEEALRALDQADPACAREKDLWRQGRVQLLRGTVKVRQREIPVAIPLLEQALATLRRARAGRDPSRVEALIMLGTALGYTGNYPGAIRRFEEAVASEVARHDPVLRGRALWGIGLAQRKAGNLEAAGRYLAEARDAFESAEELRELMRVLQNLGQLLFEQGEPKEALRHLHHALRVLDRLGEPANLASIATEIARIHLSTGDLEDAEAFTRQALEGARAAGDPVEVAEATTLLARTRVARKDPAGAIKLYKDALEAFRLRKMADQTTAVARELGLLLRERGAHAQAAAYLAMSLETPGVRAADAVE